MVNVFGFYRKAKAIATFLLDFIVYCKLKKYIICLLES